MGSKRRRPSASQTIGGVLFGFEQQVLRSTPPPQELVHHARPDAPTPAADGSLLSIELPPGEPADGPIPPPEPHHPAGPPPGDPTP